MPEATGNVGITRQLLRKLFPEKITFTAKLIEGTWMYEYAAKAPVGGIVAGILGAKGMASPTGTTHFCTPLVRSFSGRIKAA